MNLVYVAFLALLCVLIHVIFYRLRKPSPSRIPCAKLVANNELLWILYKSRFHYFKDLYDSLAPHKYATFFKLLTPKLVVRDPQLIKQVLVQESDNFTSREKLFFLENDTLTRSIFNMEGAEWKRTRASLTPGFSPFKLKSMFSLVYESASHLEEELLNSEDGEGSSVNMKDLLSRYTMDVICSVNFGLNPNSIRDKDSTFYRMGQKFRTGGIRGKLKYLFLSLPIPQLLKRQLNVSFFNCDMTNFFRDVLLESIRYRKTARVSSRNDFLQIYMRLLETSYEDARSREITGELVTWNVDLILAQCLAIITTGFFTTSNSLNFAFYEIANNSRIREKLHAEIDEAVLQSEGEINFEIINKMEYLHRVVQETLRKYSPVPVFTRKCTNTCTLFGDDDNLLVEKGTVVSVSVSGLHHDPQYYPDPQKFNPDRFDKKNEATRHPYCFLPFGSGPRYCIGDKFAELTMKTAIVTLLRSFTVSVLPENVLQFLSTTIGTEAKVTELQFTKR